MYPYLRLVKVMLSSRNEGKPDPFKESVLALRVNVWDLDIFLELNNGRHLTLMDLGRFHLGKSAGLFEVLKEYKWGLMVAGVNVKYRHRLKYGQRFTLSTRLIDFDDRWFFFHQQIKVGEKVCSQALVKTAVTSREGLVPTIKMREAMGIESWQPEKSEWIKDWENSSWTTNKI